MPALDFCKHSGAQERIWLTSSTSQTPQSNYKHNGRSPPTLQIVQQFCGIRIGDTSPCCLPPHTLLSTRDMPPEAFHYQVSVFSLTAKFLKAKICLGLLLPLRKVTFLPPQSPPLYQYPSGTVAMCCQVTSEGDPMNGQPPKCPTLSCPAQGWLYTP